jgi:uncharacterized protein YjbI with pentapeptide repeats
MAEENEKPLTREDVLRLIKENGGKAKGLDLSRKVFEESIDLHGRNLSGIILSGADLSGSYPPPECNTGFWGDDSPETKGAHLEKADLVHSDLREAELSFVHFELSDLVWAKLDKAKLWNAHLEKADLTHTSLKEADLEYACLQEARLHGTNLQYSNLSGAKLQMSQLFDAKLKGARLNGANLEGADLSDAELAGAYLSGAQFDNSTKLHDTNWGDYLIGEEIDGYFDSALDTYRRLKIWYTNAGMYDVAGKFFYREMEARRKARHWKAEPHLKLWDWILRLLCGYGEEWPRVIIWSAAVVLGLALIYFAIGTLTPNTFLNSLYYSSVSFTALGYGSWAPKPTGWVKGLGAVEAFMGVFMMALFLVTFTRKMTR